MNDEARWLRNVQYALIISGLGFLILSAGFFFRWSWAIDLWPWTDSRLSHIFVSSILAAIGAPLIWLGCTGEIGASAAGALNLVVIYTGLTGYFALLYTDQKETHLLAALIFCAVGMLANLGLFVWTRRFPIRDPRLMPRPVRLSFGLFGATLVAVSLLLLFQAEHVFPWPLNAQSSVVYGWMFLGAAVYFIYPIRRPYWHDATGQLIGFLAYDLVLIGPYLAHFSDVESSHLLSLIIYVSFIIYSGGLAIYYLVVNQTTRVWSARASQTRLEPPGATARGN